MMTKRCTKCGTEYPATREYFYARKTSRDGLHTYCKSCMRGVGQKYYEANPEKHREYQRKYREANPEKKREYNREYYQANREKWRERRESHREEGQEYRREYRRANPEKKRADSHRRRALKRGTEGTHTAADIQAQARSQYDAKGRLRCWWCGKIIKGKYHVDHRIPLDRGGGNGPGNLCIAHERCNLSKQNKMPWEWAGRLL